MGTLYYGDNLDILTRYIAMMAPRLVELLRAIKLTGFVPPTSAHGTVPCGALYLHCNPTASHYL